MNGAALRDLAHAMAVVAHEGQSRKGTGEPYIRHVERVADAVYGWKAKTVAYLHDLVEDTEASFATLACFFPAEILEAVDYLTRVGGHRYSEYIERLAREVEHGEPSALLAANVKLADLADNLRDINDDPSGGASMAARYNLAMARLLNARGIGEE